MSEQDFIDRMEKWGYYLLPKSHPHCFGHTGLLIAIRETPTKQHFDPELIHLRLGDKDNLARLVTLKLKPAFSSPRHVCPGRVVLYDRIDKRVHFFTFGGVLETISASDETIYFLYSPGPILEITGNLGSLPDQLAFEIEGLLGQCKARWASNDNGFACRLAQIDPGQFYLTSLQAVLMRYQQHQALRRRYFEFYTALLQEKEWLAQAGQWPVTLPLLEDLFDPNRCGPVALSPTGQ
ncbi:MAG: hypothetical protein JW953_01185 [Anaerolineae bacterium]|nr:hypothetical protein [Anaerolineae bacterium]